MKRLNKTSSISDQQETLAKIRQLLESVDAEQLRLALHLLEGSKAPGELLSYLIGLSFWHIQDTIREQAYRILKRSASYDLMRHVQNTWTPDFLWEFNEVKVAHFLRAFTKHPAINRNVLAMSCLKYGGKGGKFCLENKVADPMRILELIIQDKELYLANYALMELPAEVGYFPELHILNISGNHFESLPKEIYFLKNLQGLYFNRTPLNAQAIQELETHYPLMFAKKYTYEGHDYRREQAFLKAYILYSKALHLWPQMEEAQVYSNMTRVQSGRSQTVKQHVLHLLKKLDQELVQNPLYAQAWYYRACLLCLLGDAKACIKSLKHAITLNKLITIKAHEDEIFEIYREIPEFRKLLWQL